MLAFRHPDRGVDAVPVVYAPAEDGTIVLPVDTVKPKIRSGLSRLDSLRRDGRCVLLVERYVPDWSRLWWVRVHGDARVVEGDLEALLGGLRARYPQYRDPGSIVAAVVLTPNRLHGWSAA